MSIKKDNPNPHAAAMVEARMKKVKPSKRREIARAAAMARWAARGGKQE